MLISISLLQQTHYVQIVLQLPSQHVDATLSIDYLGRRHDELLIFEKLVQEPYRCDLPVGDSSNEVYHDFLLFVLLLTNSSALLEEL